MAPSFKGIQLTAGNLFVLVVISLVVLQVLGLVFVKTWGADVKLGPMVIVVTVAIAAALGLVLVKKLFQAQEVTQKDLMAFLVVAAILLVLAFYLRDLVPEIFEPSAQSLQAMLGFP